MTTFRNGDRVVVESPIYSMTDRDVCDLTDEGAPVGTEGEILTGEPDFEGDVYVKFSTANGSTSSLYANAEGLLKVADLPRLAKERAPSYEVGDRLRVLAKWGFTVGVGEVVEVIRVFPSRVQVGETNVEIRTSTGAVVTPWASSIAGKVEKVVEPAEAVAEIVLTAAQIERGQAVYLATEILGKDALVESITAVARYIMSGVIAR